MLASMSIYLLGTIMAIIPAQPFMAVVTAVLHLDSRTRKDGFDLDLRGGRGRVAARPTPVAGLPCPDTPRPGVPYGQPQTPYGQTQVPYRTDQMPYGQTQAPYGQTQMPYGQTQMPYAAYRLPMDSPQTTARARTRPIPAYQPP